MKILITGGAGFLGLHLAKYAEKYNQRKKNNQQFEIYLLDIATFERNEYPKDSQFINLDIRNKKLIEKLFGKEKFDYVIHAAAALPLWKKEDIFLTNVKGTKNILQASLENNTKRVIFISSTAVYGVTKKHPIEENDPLVGVGPYGQSKIEAEKLCWQFIKKGLNITIIRPKTFIGPYRLGVFEILFDWVHDGKKIPVIGSGNNRYQLLDVEDLVEAIYLILEKSNSKKKLNDVFNIGADKFDTVREDLEKLFNYAYQKKIKNQKLNPAVHERRGNPALRKERGKIKNFKKSTILPTPAFLVKKVLWLFEKLKLSPLYQWVYDTADKDSFVSIEKIKNTLNWQPKYSNSQALIRAYQWYLNNYQDIKSKPAGITHRVGWKQGILGIIKKIM